MEMKMVLSHVGHYRYVKRDSPKASAGLVTYSTARRRHGCNRASPFSRVDQPARERSVQLTESPVVRRRGLPSIDETNPVDFPSAFKTLRIKWLVTVFPSVPLTPIVVMRLQGIPANA